MKKNKKKSKDQKESSESFEVLKTVRKTPSFIKKSVGGKNGSSGSVGKVDGEVKKGKKDSGAVKNVKKVPSGGKISDEDGRGSGGIKGRNGSGSTKEGKSDKKADKYGKGNVRGRKDGKESRVLVKNSQTVETRAQKKQAEETSSDSYESTEPIEYVESVVTSSEESSDDKESSTKSSEDDGSSSESSESDEAIEISSSEHDTDSESEYVDSQPTKVIERPKRKAKTVTKKPKQKLQKPQKRPKRARKSVERYTPDVTPNRKVIKRKSSFSRFQNYKHNSSENDDHELLRTGSSLGSSIMSDSTPLNIDESITWDKVGGLDDHINALKEMVFFPMLYPEVFQKFGISAPKGVIFYGPPGCGKTLIARALANSCSRENQTVTFYMRKGADILSKWVGETEKQLKLLFEQARATQPSIIFFDEIDGLAPVRSSRQDQIHSSIVSTLLGLMDGLDSRGQVIVIGATNRIDHIDPALRRPGRFDREFAFTLPSTQKRKKIIEIHTSEWKPPLDEKIIDMMANKTVGYCGADLKSLVAEASIRALRRTFPQIYQGDSKYVIDTDKIGVTLLDFLRAFEQIKPSSSRSAKIHAVELPQELRYFLKVPLETVISASKKMLPHRNSNSKLDQRFNVSDDDYDFANNIIYSKPYRPRMLICGEHGSGQRQIASALLYELEDLSVHTLDMASLHTDISVRTIEEAIISRINQCLSCLPSILFLPGVDSWWEITSVISHNILIKTLQEIDPNIPLFILFTSEVPSSELDPDIISLFQEEHIVTLETHLKSQGIKKFFGQLSNTMSLPYIPLLNEEPAKLEIAKNQMIEMSPELLLQKEKHIFNVNRRLREAIRDILHEVKGSRKYNLFFGIYNTKKYPDYHEEIPVDLEIIANKNDNQEYFTFDQFLNDVDILYDNCTEYFINEDDDDIISKCNLLKDDILGLMDLIDPSFITECKDAYTLSKNLETYRKYEKNKLDKKKKNQSEPDRSDKKRNREDDNEELPTKKKRIFLERSLTRQEKKSLMSILNNRRKDLLNKNIEYFQMLYTRIYNLICEARESPQDNYYETLKTSLENLVIEE